MAFYALKSIMPQMYPGKPKYTEKDVPDLSGKVCIVTGSNTGIGKDIAQILYSKNARVYVAARSEAKALAAMDDIRATTPKSSGALEFLRLDLADLTTIKSTVQEFLSKEERLHLLFNNAGVGYPEPGSKTVQGLELQLGVNCVGPFLLTKLLSPILASTAKVSAPNTVRVLWTASSATEGVSVAGMMENLDYHNDKSGYHKYATSKVGNFFHASEYAARHRSDGVISVSFNPGHLDSDFWRTFGGLVHWLLRHFMLYPARYGAYTSVFAGVSPEVTLENTGAFLAPWGKIWWVSPEKANAAKPRSEGGAGMAQDFWEWSEEQVKAFT